MNDIFNNHLRLADNRHEQASCTLTRAAWKARKTQLLGQIRQKILKQAELESGYAYRFKNSDLILDRLMEFIRTERKTAVLF